MVNKRLDFIIYGATGFTGKYTVKEAARLSKEYNFTFGVAGRRTEALEAVVKEFAPNIDDVPIFTCEVDDAVKLKSVTKQAKVFINCCGPYRFLGEPVIQSCIYTRTHYVDVSGETVFLEQMQLKYHKSAQDSGVYIVSACGFDSIPCDLGIIYAQKMFNGDVNTVETYLDLRSTADNVSGPQINYGTWFSLVYGIADMSKLRSIRTKLFSKKLPEYWPELKKRGFIHKNEESYNFGWSIKFPGSDRSVAMRSQRFRYEHCNQRPAQIQTYITLRACAIVKLAILAFVLNILTKFEYGRKLLLKFPTFFSGGLVSREGPTVEAMEKAEFSIIMLVSGWTTKLPNPSDQHLSLPNKEMKVLVSGKNPAYGTTCTALMLSAITILKEADKMPDNGGVLTPGAAFANTSLIEELNKKGVTFEVLYVKEPKKKPVQPV